MLKRPIKRKHASGDADNQIAGAPKNPVSKRRKKGDGQAVDVELPRQRIIIKMKEKITQRVVEKEEMVVQDEDEMDVDEEVSEVVQGSGLVREDEEEEGPEHDNGEEEGEETSLHRKTAEDFFNNLYHTRFGRLNHGRLLAKTTGDELSSVYASWRANPDGAGVEQTEQQQQLEAFFQQQPNLWDGKQRLEFIKPYLDRKQKQILKKWSGLSLAMRLNLIDSLRVVEKSKHVEDKCAWASVREEAGEIRGQCADAQYHMNDPEDWEQYDKENGLTRGKAPRFEKSIDDQLLALAESDEEGEENTPAMRTTKTKTAVQWESFEFTDAQQATFDALCGQHPITDVDPRRPMTKGQWRPEEFRFLHEWMTFKGPRTNWKGTTSTDVLEMSLAHKAFFTDFGFEGGKKKSLRRGGPAIVRHLKEFGGPEFEGWLPLPVEKGRNGSAPVAGDDVDDDANDDEVKEHVEESQEDGEAQVDTETRVELNKAGYASTGRKKPEDVKRYFEEKTGQKVPKKSEDN